MDKASMPKRGATWSASGQAENKGEGCLTGIVVGTMLMNLFIILDIKEVIPPGGEMPVGNVENFKVDFLGYEEGCLKMSP